jgi:hypothetical protein
MSCPCRQHLFNPIDELNEVLEKRGVCFLDIVKQINQERKLKKFSEKVVKLPKEKELIYLEQTNERKCSECKNWLKWTPDNFHRDKQKPGGLKTICKQCLRDYTNKRNNYLIRIR